MIFPKVSTRQAGSVGAVIALTAIIIFGGASSANAGPSVHVGPDHGMTWFTEPAHKVLTHNDNSTSSGPVVCAQGRAGITVITSVAAVCAKGQAVWTRNGSAYAMGGVHTGAAGNKFFSVN